MNPTAVVIWSAIAVIIFLIVLIGGVVYLRRISESLQTVTKTLDNLKERHDDENS